MGTATYGRQKVSPAARRTKPSVFRFRLSQYPNFSVCEWWVACGVRQISLHSGVCQYPKCDGGCNFFPFWTKYLPAPWCWAFTSVTILCCPYKVSKLVPRKIVLGHEEHTAHRPRSNRNTQEAGTHMPPTTHEQTHTTSLGGGINFLSMFDV